MKVEGRNRTMVADNYFPEVSDGFGEEHDAAFYFQLCEKIEKISRKFLAKRILISDMRLMTLCM